MIYHSVLYISQSVFLENILISLHMPELRILAQTRSWEYDRIPQQSCCPFSSVRRIHYRDFLLSIKTVNTKEKKKIDFCNMLWQQLR